MLPGFQVSPRAVEEPRKFRPSAIAFALVQLGER